MAITINIYYKGENGNARKFAQEMVDTGITERIRSEEGNIRYDYFFSMDDSETVLLIDEWSDQKALDVHHSLPLMSDIMMLREKYDLHMKVERYVSEADLEQIGATDSINKTNNIDDDKYIRK